MSEVGCWAHARRKFVDAQKSSPNEAIVALGHIRRLYKVEKTAKELSAEARWKLRQKLSTPRLESLRKYLCKQQERALPKSPIGMAIGYTLRNWEALCRYTEDGDLKIDNNASERALRQVVVGRKNWMFAGSEKGGHTAAVLYSIVMTCKRHGVDPFEYLRDILTRLPDHLITRLDELLPDRWKAAKDSAISDAPTSE
jgi:transposase